MMVVSPVLLVKVIESGVSVRARYYDDFAEHEIEMLDKKASSKSAKDKEKEKADEVLISIILETLLGSAGMTASEILKANANREEFADVSNQKVSALLKKLVDRDSVKKFTDKRKSYFHLA